MTSPTSVSVTPALYLAQKVHPSYTNFSLVPSTATRSDIGPFLPGGRAATTSLKRGPRRESLFPVKLHEVLSDPNLSDVITWMPHGRSWYIPDPSAFVKRVGRKLCRSRSDSALSNYASFRRQVCLWGFRRSRQGQGVYTYYHELFLRGMPHLVQFMERPLAATSSEAKLSDVDETDLCETSMVYPVPLTWPFTTSVTSSACNAGQHPQEQAREDHHTMQINMADIAVHAISNARPSTSTSSVPTFLLCVNPTCTELEFASSSSAQETSATTAYRTTEESVKITHHESFDQRVQMPDQALSMTIFDSNSSKEQIGGTRKRARSDHQNTQRKRQHVLLPVESKLLSSDGDPRMLSRLMCLVRAQIEVFAATKQDTQALRRMPPALGRVGIRCVHCTHLPRGERAKGAVSYPSSIRLMHQSVRNWQRYHFRACREIPKDVRDKYERLKSANEASVRNGSQQYWIECCENMGMVDAIPAGNGIFFYSRDREMNNFVSRMADEAVWMMKHLRQQDKTLKLV